MQVSTKGGTEPIWGRSGRTLYFRHGEQIIAATVTTSPTFSIGARQVALDGDYFTSVTHPDWDIAPDGSHFLMLKRSGEEAQTVVVLNWLQEVRARMAAGAKP